MKKTGILIIFICIILLVSISYFFFNSYKNKNLAQQTDQPVQLRKIEHAPQPKAFPVETLPAFAAQDCAQKGGIVRSVTQKGLTLEKCIFEEE